jgi:hypothetical protein
MFSYEGVQQCLATINKRIHWTFGFTRDAFALRTKMNVMIFHHYKILCRKRIERMMDFFFRKNRVIQRITRRDESVFLIRFALFVTQEKRGKHPCVRRGKGGRGVCHGQDDTEKVMGAQATKAESEQTKERPLGRFLYGAPQTIRTSGLFLRREALYPAELGAQKSCATITNRNRRGKTYDDLDDTPIFPYYPSAFKEIGDGSSAGRAGAS